MFFEFQKSRHDCLEFDIECRIKTKLIVDNFQIFFNGFTFFRQNIFFSTLRDFFNCVLYVSNFCCFVFLHFLRFWISLHSQNWCVVFYTKCVMLELFELVCHWWHKNNKKLIYFDTSVIISCNKVCHFWHTFSIHRLW